MTSHSPVPSRGRTSQSGSLNLDTTRRRASASSASKPVVEARQPEMRSRSRSYSQRRSQSSNASCNGRSPSSSPDRASRTRSQSYGKNGERTRSSSHRGRSYDRGISSRDEREEKSDRAAALQRSKIVVEKLTKNVTQAHLMEIFGTYGRIDSLDLPINRQCEASLLSFHSPVSSLCWWALSYPVPELSVCLSHSSNDSLIAITVMTNRGTAYIVYENPSASESAITHMHEGQIDGAVINVSIVLPRRAFSQSPQPARSGRPPPLPPMSSRGVPSFNHRGGLSNHRYRASPPRHKGGYRGRGGREDYEDGYYPVRRGYSRSRSRSRSWSPSRSRSPSRTCSFSPAPANAAARALPPNRRRPRRSYSYSRSRSPSRTPSLTRPPPPRSYRHPSDSPRRRRRRNNGPVGRGRRRSPSYSSYGSYTASSRSRSPSRDRGRYRDRGRGRTRSRS